MATDFSKICSVCKRRQASGRRVNRHCCGHHFADDEDKVGSHGAVASQRKIYWSHVSTISSFQSYRRTDRTVLNRRYQQERDRSNSNM